MFGIRQHLHLRTQVYAPCSPAVRPVPKSRSAKRQRSGSISEVNFTFEGHKQSRSRGSRILSEELAAGDVSLVYVAHRLHRHWDRTSTLRKVLQTQWHVVSHASQVFVVGVIQPDGTVHGGTGWSVELARRWNKQAWVFDQTHEAWYRWTGREWSKGVPVIETPTFAGTGTRFLNEAGKRHS